MASSLLARGPTRPSARDEAEGDEQLFAFVAQEEVGELPGRDGILRAGNDARYCMTGS